MNQSTQNLAGLFIAAESAVADANLKRQTFANAMVQLFNDKTTFAQHEESAAGFKAAYNAKKGGNLSPEALDTAFSRALASMNEYLKLIDALPYTIPKSGSADAQRKANERAEHQRKVQALANSTKPDQLAKLAASGNKTAAAAIAYLGTQARDKLKAENGAMLKAIRAELSTADSATLKKIAGLLNIKP